HPHLSLFSIGSLPVVWALDLSWEHGREACRRHATGTTVKIKIAWIGKTKEPTVTSLSEEYLSRISRYLEVEGLAVRDERDLVARFGKDRKGGSKYHLLLLDSRGKELTSEQFAKLIGNHFDR